MSEVKRWMEGVRYVLKGTELNAMVSEIERLRAALREYGVHLNNCPYGIEVDHGICNCGLDAALRGEEGK